MNTWIDLAGWTLLHFIWQGALVAAVAATGLRVLRTAPARYALSCCALAAMFAGPVVTAWSIAGVMSPQPTVALSPNAGESAGALTVSPTSRPAAAPATRSASRPTRALPAIALDPLMPYVVTLWLSGVALLLTRLA